jgi:hypothetical protein
MLALTAIGIIGADLLLRKEQKRREADGGRDRAPLPEGVDPASLRKRRPMTNKLMGAVLIASVLVLLIVLVPVF